MITPYWPVPDIPKYKPGKFRRWACLPTPALTKHNTAGYFQVYKEQPTGWMFQRDGKVWMSLTAMELESQTPMIAAARGHTVIAGLGMGFALYNIAKKPEVDKVTVLEIDPEVIALLDKVSNWRNWPGNNKVELVLGDARAYVPEAPVDFLFADTWPTLGGDVAVPMTQAIQANVQASSVAWWGQEVDFVDYCRDRHLPGNRINRNSYQQYALHVALPMIEQHSLIYPRLCLLAVALQAAGNCRDLATRRSLQLVCAELMQEDVLGQVLREPRRW